MAQFLGSVQGSRGEATRLGDKNSGLQVEACSWQGKVVVRMWFDKVAGVDRYSVELRPHHGNGVNITLVNGEIVGEDSGKGSR